MGWADAPDYSIDVWNTRHRQPIHQRYACHACTYMACASFRLRGATRHRTAWRPYPRPESRSTLTSARRMRTVRSGFNAASWTEA